MTDAIVTEAGKRLLEAIAINERLSLRGARIAGYVPTIAAVEAEAAQRALDDVRAKVEALRSHAKPYESHLNAWDAALNAISYALQDRGADREDVKPPGCAQCGGIKRADWIGKPAGCSCADFLASVDRDFGNWFREGGADREDVSNG